MQLEKYNLEIDDSLISFTFISEGHLGKIEKSIKYEEMQKGIYNLGFGDKNQITGEVDDIVIFAVVGVPTDDLHKNCQITTKLKT